MEHKVPSDATPERHRTPYSAGNAQTEPIHDRTDIPKMRNTIHYLQGLWSPKRQMSFKKKKGRGRDPFQIKGDIRATVA